jgi:hypothetical protein
VAYKNIEGDQLPLKFSSSEQDFRTSKSWFPRCKLKVFSNIFGNTTPKRVNLSKIILPASPWVERPYPGDKIYE